jgi:hypothetical protein
MSDIAHVDGLVPRPPHYHSYLLRFWEERGETDTARIWRFMLQDPQTEERYGFADLDALVVWIQEKTILHEDSQGAQGIGLEDSQGGG